VERVDPRRHGVERRPLRRRATLQQRDLQQERLVEGEGGAGPTPVGVVLRPMDALQRRRVRQEAVALPDGVRQRVLNACRLDGVEGLGDGRLDLPARDRRGRRVHRDGLLGPSARRIRIGGSLVVEEFVVGVGELQDAVETRDLA